jgi:hypothetical protein
MINGNEFAWEDIKIVIPGKATPINGAVEINYNYKKDHVNIKGAGAKTVGLGRGTEDCEGDLTLLQSEVEGLMASLPKGKNLTHLPAFTITVAYAPVGAKAVVDQLLFCRIKEMPKGMKTGDSHMEIKLPLAIADILYNV